MSEIPFDDLDSYVALTRAAGLALSPDGTRLVTAVSRLDEKSTAYVSSLWEIDPTGAGEPRRLTRGPRSQSGAAFTASGDLLFVAPGSGEDDAPSALWCLPAVGEAYRVAGRGGGVSGLVTAADTDSYLVLTDVLGSSGDAEQDERVRTARKDGKISAILHTGYPVRYWDHDLGPALSHLLIGSGAEPDTELTDLTTMPGPALREASYSLAPDGSFLVTTWRVGGPLASQRLTLVRIDTATGDRTVLIDDPDADAQEPVISPDGRRVAYLREALSSPEQAVRYTVHVLDLESGESVQWAPDWDRWATSLAWTRDASALIVTADQDGRGPIFRLTVEEGVAVIADDWTYTDVIVAPDGATLFALRSSYAAPSHPVRIDLATGGVTALRSPADVPALPGILEEIETTAADGSRVRGWLAVPDGASDEAPAPLMLWVHGGPLGSWNGWSWRWNPWLMVARGYAVLLPDPALSTGYGQAFVQRGWGRWGKEPFTDLMSITDAAERLPQIDGSRTAAMGGSFGGYMANWIAGHTDRFDAIVTHASLWALDQFGPTTDAAWYWAREMTPEMAFENSPHLAVADIVTPMLVIHGDKDYRVPIGEGLRLWYELLSESGLPADDFGTTDHRFLYFPTENHWILTPQHAKIWYQVVLAFLSEHVLGEAAELSESLGS